MSPRSSKFVFMKGRERLTLNGLYDLSSNWASRFSLALKKNALVLLSTSTISLPTREIVAVKTA